MAMDDREIGERIAYWRERRGVTQKLLADRIGRSKSWIEKVEAGSRSRERKANHLVDVARGYSQWGMRDEALERLLEAETLAPREVNCRPLARGTIENLVERSRGKPSGALRSLAERAGVTA